MRTVLVCITSLHEPYLGQKHLACSSAPQLDTLLACASCTWLPHHWNLVGMIPHCMPPGVRPFICCLRVLHSEHELTGLAGVQRWLAQLRAWPCTRPGAPPGSARWQCCCSAPSASCSGRCRQPSGSCMRARPPPPLRAILSRLLQRWRTTLSSSPAPCRPQARTLT